MAEGRNAEDPSSLSLVVLPGRKAKGSYCVPTKGRAGSRATQRCAIVDASSAAPWPGPPSSGRIGSGCGAASSDGRTITRRSIVRAPGEDSLTRIVPHRAVPSTPAISQDCSTCHNMLAVDEPAPKILTDLGMEEAKPAQ